MRARNRTRGYRREIERKERAVAGGMEEQNEHVEGGSKVRPGLSHWLGPRRSNQVPCQAPSSLASLDWRHALIILVSRGAIRGANLLESSLRSQALALAPPPPLPPRPSPLCRESSVRTLLLSNTFASLGVPCTSCSDCYREPLKPPRRVNW